MKKISLLLTIIISSQIIMSCASILNGKEQKIKVQARKPNAKVYLNNDYIGSGSQVEVKMPRNLQEQQVKIEVDGYKDVYLAHYQDRKSPLYILSWVPFGILFYPPFADVGPKSYNYDKELLFDKNYQKIKYRNDDEKYVYIKNTAFDIDEDDFVIKRTKNRIYRKGKDKFKSYDTNNETIEYDNSIFTDNLNEILLKYNYIDTTNTILRKKTNTTYINAKIKSVELNEIYEVKARGYKSFMLSNVTIDWELTDFYGQPQFSKEYIGDSGEFVINTNTPNDNIKDCISDAISSSFLKFIDEDNVRNFLNKTNEEAIKYDFITIQKPVSPTDIGSSMKSTLTIETDSGHGSGFVISKDGYIVTNLHVVATSKKLNVITNDGENIEAKLIRKNENKDLALIKVNKTFNSAFDIFSDDTVKIGQEIFAIGTPNSIELGQTLSKGIVSGVRSNETENYIQTDASVNSGNSGGPLIDKNGVILGVVNAKLKGLGVEGIGFAIPIHIVKEALFLN